MLIRKSKTKMTQMKKNKKLKAYEEMGWIETYLRIEKTRRRRRRRRKRWNQVRVILRAKQRNKKWNMNNCQKLCKTKESNEMKQKWFYLYSVILACGQKDCCFMWLLRIRRRRRRKGKWDKIKNYIWWVDEEYLSFFGKIKITLIKN